MITAARRVVLDDLQGLYNPLEATTTAPLTIFPKEATWRGWFFAILDDPNSCRVGKVFSIWLIVLIFTFVVVFVLETVQSVRSQVPEWFWDEFEVFCVVWFTFEYVGRLVLVEGKLAFVFGPMNLIDLLSILPYYLNLFFGAQSSSVVLRVLRVVRVFRIFKMGKYSNGMKLMATTMRESAHTLSLLLIYLGLATVLFGSLIYYTEMGHRTVNAHGEVVFVRDGTNEESSPFTSIPASFWWTLVTMTTVGYGDITPVTPLGRVVGVFAMLCGVLVIALPVNVVGGNFVQAYFNMNRAPSQEDSPKEFLSHCARADFYEEKFALLATEIENMTQSLESTLTALREIRAKNKIVDGEYESDEDELTNGQY